MNGKRSLADAFASEASEKVVSIVAKETGFQGIQPVALESLSNILGSCKKLGTISRLCYTCLINNFLL
jgi:hypothetical protein